MKLAVIAPYSGLQLVQEDTFHLTLMHLYSESQEYADFYRHVAKGHVMLDNSAYEKFDEGSVAFSDIRFEANKYKATEVVLPDKLLDGPATFNMTSSAIRELANSGTTYEKNTMRFVLVPQGEDLGEWIWCMRRMMWEWANYLEGWKNPTLCISKIYDRQIEGGRALLAEHIRKWYPAVDIHLLGYTTYAQLAACSAYKIRSVDTARPFVCALANVFVSVETIKRQANFFEAPLSEEQLDIASINIQQLRKLVEPL